MTHICNSELSHHWFRKWLVACSAISHYLNKLWFVINSFLRTSCNEIVISSLDTLNLLLREMPKNFHWGKCVWKCHLLDNVPLGIAWAKRANYPPFFIRPTGFHIETLQLLMPINWTWSLRPRLREFWRFRWQCTWRSRSISACFQLVPSHYRETFRLITNGNLWYLTKINFAA